MKTGKTKQGLMEALKEINGFTQVDSAYLPGQKLTLEATKTYGSFKRWRINAKTKTLRKKTFDTPEKAIAAAMGERVIEVSGRKTGDKVTWKLISDGERATNKMFDSIDEAVDQLPDESNFSVTIHSQREISDDFVWKIKESSSALHSSESYASGKGLNMLMSAIQDLDKALTITDTLVVLCLTASQASKSWNGLYQTTWILLDPACPFIINEDGSPRFETITLNLKATEYKLCIDTQLAFYNTATKDLYPIPSDMLFPLSRVMQCGGSFTERAMNGTPLGQAHILANNLLSMGTVQLFYRERTDKVKPIIGICGRNFCEYSQIEFFENMLKLCADNGFGEIERWTVGDDATTVNVGITQFTAAYKPCISLRISDLPMNPASVKAYAKIGVAKISVFSRSEKHSKVLKEKGFESLFIDDDKTVDPNNPWTLFDEFKVFANKFKKLEKSDVYLDIDWLAEQQEHLNKSWIVGAGLLVPLLNNMGAKRRIEALARLKNNIQAGKTYNAAILFCNVVELIFCDLPPIYRSKQEVLFGELLENFLTMVEN